MTRRPFLSALAASILVAAGAAGLAARQTAATRPVDPALAAELDAIFDAPVFARALVGVRVESLGTGEMLYARNSNRLVVPASNMKILTLAAAAERLGWDFRYVTTLESTGTTEDGTLHGDLVVTGSGDPSIVSQDFGPSPVFSEWADALWNAGIRRVDGRIIGDDNAFDDDDLGAGWAWDYLADGYAAPMGALSYNENVAVLRAWPGAAPGAPVRVELTPPGHGLVLTNALTTGPADSTGDVTLLRLPGDVHLTVRGRVPAGGKVVTETASIDRPTRVFVEALRLALAGRGVLVAGPAVDIDDITDAPPAGARRLVARRESMPLSSLSGYFMKVSQNFYAETLLKTVGHATGVPGSAESGRKAATETLVSWGVPADSFVMYDGSGLSRYDYVTADGIVTILRHVWQDERLRGPFLAALPVGGHDGTLRSRMKDPILDAHVQAKTGTISNVRSLSGYLHTRSGDTLVFSMIANHFTAPSAEVDKVVEAALAKLAQR